MRTGFRGKCSGEDGILAEIIFSVVDFAWAIPGSSFIAVFISISGPISIVIVSATTSLIVYLIAMALMPHEDDGR